MAFPLTLANIKQHIDDVPYQALAKICSNEALQTLASPNGAKLDVQGKHSNVRIDWHRDAQTNTIDGIFFRVHNNEYIQAWRIIKDQDFDEPYLITITHQHTTPSKIMFIHQGAAEQIFEQCVGASHEDPIAFEAEDLQDPGQIQAFFAKNQDMLPDSIRQRVFPQAPPKKPIDGKDPAAPKSDNSYLYIAGALLLVLGIAFVAKRYFAAPREV